MTRQLVTGDSGFLGSHLFDLLLAWGNNPVHVVDNLGTSPLPLRRSLEAPGPNNNLTHSITDLAGFCGRFPDERFDEIHHLAPIVGPHWRVATFRPHFGVDCERYDGYCGSEMWRNHCRGLDERGLRRRTAGVCSEGTPKIVPAASPGKVIKVWR